MPRGTTLDNIYKKNPYIDYLLLFDPFSLSPFTNLSLSSSLSLFSSLSQACAGGCRREGKMAAAAALRQRSTRQQWRTWCGGGHGVAAVEVMAHRRPWRGGESHRCPHPSSLTLRQLDPAPGTWSSVRWRAWSGDGHGAVAEAAGVLVPHPPSRSGSRIRPQGPGVAEPPKLARLKCAGHHYKGNISSNALQTE